MIDLHMHTTYSDGEKSIEEILKMCEEKKLKYISITDHNTCMAYYDENLININTFSGKIIIGCELNANFNNRLIEILAYNINPDDIMKFREKYYSEDKMKESNKKAYTKFLNILDKKGIKYNEDEIQKSIKETKIKKNMERFIWEEIVKYPENKEILGEEYFTSLKIFYRKEIANPDSEYFTDRISNYPNVKEVVEYIHQIGGIAFLAHPFEYEFKDTIKFLDDLNKEVKLDGIECYHPSAEIEDRIDVLIDYAKEHNLKICGGSDYHGKIKPDIEIGIGKGSLNISEKILDEWV